MIPERVDLAMCLSCLLVIPLPKHHVANKEWEAHAVGGLSECDR